MAKVAPLTTENTPLVAPAGRKGPRKVKRKAKRVAARKRKA